MSEDNKALIRRYVDRYNRYAWDELRELLDPEYVHHSGEQVRDADGFVEGSEWFLAGIPDFQIEIVDLVAEGDRVAARYIATGTHMASMLGETPTSERIGLNGITLFRIADGRIAEDWEQMDEGELRRQIGAPGV